jgi:hypothetical protein
VLSNANDVFFPRPRKLWALARGDEAAQQTPALIQTRKKRHIYDESQVAPDLVLGEGREFTGSGRWINRYWV